MALFTTYSGRRRVLHIFNFVRLGLLSVKRSPHLGIKAATLFVARLLGISRRTFHHYKEDGETLQRVKKSAILPSGALETSPGTIDIFTASQQVLTDHQTSSPTGTEITNRKHDRRPSIIGILETPRFTAMLIQRDWQRGRGRGEEG